MAEEEDEEEGEITEEEFNTAVLVFAHYLGIDLENESALLHIADNGLRKLPKGWELGIGEGGENKGIPYFFNTKTGESKWKHPNEAALFEMVKDERKLLGKKKNKGKHVDDIASPSSPTKDNTINKKSSSSSSSQAIASTSTSIPSSPVKTKVISVGGGDGGFGDDNDNDDGRHTNRSHTKSIDSGRLDSARKQQSTTGATGNTKATSGEDTARSSSNDWSKNGKPSSSAPSPIKTIGNSLSPATTTSPVASTSMGKTSWEKKENKGNYTISKENSHKSSTPLSLSDNEEAPTERNSPQKTKNKTKDTNQNNFDNLEELDLNTTTPKSSSGIGYRKGTTTTATTTATATTMSPSRDLNKEQKEARQNRDVSDTYKSNTANNNNNNNNKRQATAFDDIDMLEDENNEENEEELVGKGVALQQENTVSTQQKSMQQQQRSHGKANLLSESTSTSSTLAFQQQQAAEILELSTIIDALKQQQQHQMQQHQQEALNLTTTYEKKLLEQREQFRTIELECQSLKNDCEFQLKKQQQQHQHLLNETTLALTTQLEAEHKQKLLAIESQLQQERDSGRNDVAALRLKIQELEQENNGLNQRLNNQSSDSAHYKRAMEDIEQLRVKLLGEATQQQELHKLEIHTWTKENDELKTKLETLSRQSYIQSAESASLHERADTASRDRDSLQVALAQATQRLQALDGELGQLKANNTLLKQERDLFENDLKKATSQNHEFTEATHMSESTLRRTKTQLETEIARMQTRIAELEITNKSYRDELDRGMNQESGVLRELQRSLDKAELDCKRLNSLTKELNAKGEIDSKRVITLEAALAESQDAFYQRDRLLRDEKYRAETAETARARVEEVRNRLEVENGELKENLMQEKERFFEAMKNHKREIDEIKRQVDEQLPRLAADVVGKVEREVTQRVLLEHQTELDKQLEEIKCLKKVVADKDACLETKERGFVGQLDAIKKELQEVNNQYLKLLEQHQTALQAQEKQSTFHNIQGHAPNLFPLTFQEGGSPEQQQQQQQSSSVGVGVGVGVGVSIDGSSTTIAQDAVNVIQRQLLSLKQHLTTTLANTRNAQSNYHYFNDNSFNSSRSFLSLDVTAQQLQRKTLYQQNRIRSQLRSFESQFPPVPQYFIPYDQAYSTPFAQSSRQQQSASGMMMMMPVPMSHRMPPQPPPVSFVSPPNKVNTMFSPIINNNNNDNNNNSGNESVSNIAGPETINPIDLIGGDNGNSNDNNNNNNNNYYNNNEVQNRSQVLHAMGFQDESSLLSSDFAAIYDGGFHAGYWKAKYSMSR